MRAFIIQGVGEIAMTGEAEERSIIHEVLHAAMI